MQMLAPQRTISTLHQLSVSLWLTELSRTRLQSGDLKNLVDTEQVLGILADPTAFPNAFQDGGAYHQRIDELAASGATVEEIVLDLITDDVRDATDLFSAAYCRTRGTDGLVSFGGDPRLAYDTAATIDQAQKLSRIVHRTNILIDIPATIPGLAAITAVTALGISVNATLLFSLERYSAVIDAYITGLEQARAAGHNLSQIRSVASFPIAQMDHEITRRLNAIGSPAASALVGRAGIASAALAYQAYEQTFAGERWTALATDGAHRQRPLWNSAGAGHRHDEIRHLTGILAPGTIHGVSAECLNAVPHLGVISNNVSTQGYFDAAELIGDLDEIGIDLGEALAVLETEGVNRMVGTWVELLDLVRAQHTVGKLRA
jgi:transaldolase